MSWTSFAFAMWDNEAGCSEFLVEVAVPTGDCEDETSEENNVCLAAAGNPISTTPQLLKMVQRQQAAEPTTERDVERAWSEASAQLETKYTFQIAKPPQRQPYELSCSVYESSCDEEPHTPTLELPAGNGFGVDDEEDKRAGFEPVSFDASPHNGGIAAASRDIDVLVPPPDLG